MKIGVSSYSFLPMLQKERITLFDMCNIAKDIGYQGIEFVTFEKPFCDGKDNQKLAEKLKTHCESLGLEIIAYTVGADFLNHDPEQEVKWLCECVDIASALGASLLRHDVGHLPQGKTRYTYREAIEEIVPYIRQVTEYAQTKGVRTCTENHGALFQEPHTVEALIRGTDHPNYGWLFDMGNVLTVDSDPVQAAAIAAPYAMHVHVKDFIVQEHSSYRKKQDEWYYTRSGKHLRGTILGHGVVPIPNVLHLLKDSGYQGYYSVEFEGLEDNRIALESAYQYLEALLAPEKK